MRESFFADKIVRADREAIKQIGKTLEEDNNVSAAYTAICDAIQGEHNMNATFEPEVTLLLVLINELGITDNSVKVMKKFIANGLDVNLQDDVGNTVLLIMIACALHKEAIGLIKLLAHECRGICLPNFDLNGYYLGEEQDYTNTALTLVLAKGYKTQSYHCKKGTMTKQVFDETNNYLAVATSLLDSGASPNASGPNKFTPLHIACMRRDKDAIDLLLSRGAKLDVTDVFGNSPAHYLHVTYKEASMHLSNITQKYYLLDEIEYNQSNITDLMSHVDESETQQFSFG